MTCFHGEQITIKRFGARWSASVLLLFCLLGLSSTSVIQAEDFLDPEIAFRVEAKLLAPSQLQVTFNIANGYYLYRERFKFEAEGGKLGAFNFPKGKVKFDETFQKDVETYAHQLHVLIPVETSADFKLKVTLQGCADAGLCYPPMELILPVSHVSSGTIGNLEAAGIRPKDIPPVAASSDWWSISDTLQQGSLFAIIPLFLVLGLGLAFTPCVLPMVPILSFIIVGEGRDIKRSRGFLLSLSYVLGMALVYTSLGVAAGLLGEGLSASLQNPYVLSVFSLLMVTLSLSMFGVYQLQVPASLQTKLTYFSEGKRNGKMAGVFLMGAISALIVGPCVAAPLAGALVYISQTKNVVVGGVALFSMALGMGVPLLLVGLSAGSLLPRAGSWMEQIKRFFGVLMLAMAIWMISPVLSNWMQMSLWVALLTSYGTYLAFIHRGGTLAKLFGALFGILGMLQLIGVTTGGRDVFAPLAHLSGQVQHVKFQRVRNTNELDAILARSEGKIVMLDFYADWCVSCKEMEKLTFVAPKVKAKLDTMLLLQVDVTGNNADDKAMLKRFGLFGPPGIIFFDYHGRELTSGRVIGYQNEAKFLQSLLSLTP